jgi:hypothetical protein
MVGLLHGDRRRDVIGVDSDAHLAWDPLTGRMGRLRDSGFGREALTRREGLLERVLRMLAVMLRSVLVSSSGRSVSYPWWSSPSVLLLQVVF